MCDASSVSYSYIRATHHLDREATTSRFPRLKFSQGRGDSDRRAWSVKKKLRFGKSRFLFFCTEEHRIIVLIDDSDFGIIYFADAEKISVILYPVMLNTNV